VLIQGDGIAHFVGVAEALARQGLGIGTIEHDPVDESTAVVIVIDVLGRGSIRAVETARHVGAASVYLMDGIVEYRNTFINPRVGERFLRPAPVDVIACAGSHDSALLRSLGNEAVVTGLPRLSGLKRFERPGRGVLVSTARTPAFNDGERAVLVGALGKLRDEFERVGEPAIWRLTGGLEQDIGVENNPCGLEEALNTCAAVVSTPSTVLIESMLVGRPTALLFPFRSPCWVSAAWRLEGDVSSPELRSLLKPTRLRLDRQEQLLRDAHDSTKDPAEALAGLCAELAARSWARSVA